MPTFVSKDIASWSSGTTITVSNFAVSSGTDRTLVAFIGWYDDGASGAPSVSSVVFNTSENFTYAGTRAQLNFAGSRYVTGEMWYLDNPTNTTADVVATLSEDPGTGASLYVAEYTGANNGIQTGNIGTTTGNVSTIDVNITTVNSDSLIVSGCGVQVTTKTSSPDSGTTERQDPNGYHLCCFEKSASGGADTVEADLDSGTRIAHIAVELNAAAGAPTGQPLMLRATTVPHMRAWQPRFLAEEFFRHVIPAQVGIHAEPEVP